jgi:cytochrome c oxidase subunit 2
LLWFIFRYRGRNRPRDVEGPQIHGATRLELIWTGIPILIVAGIIAFVLYKLPGIRHVPAAKAQGGPLAIRVDGHQFYWQFTYPDGHVSIQELYVPVHRVVKLDIHSQDVAHSWWIPALGGKFDAIPGVTNHTWFDAERVGTYVGQCGEFCGVYHAEMFARVVAEPSQAAYNAYVATLSNPLVLGGQQWRGVCATCHGISGQGGYGPPIATNQILVQPASLESIVRNGQNILKPVSSYMPPVGRNWTTFQFQALEAYLKKNIYKGSASGH